MGINISTIADQKDTAMEQNAGLYTLTERTLLDPQGRAVSDDDVTGVVLLGGKGKRIRMADAVAAGLVDAEAPEANPEVVTLDDLIVEATALELPTAGTAEELTERIAAAKAEKADGEKANKDGGAKANKDDDETPRDRRNRLARERRARKNAAKG